MGEFATSRINRRALLFHSGSAVVASTVAATALGTEPPSREKGSSDSLRALIEAHKIAYAAFGEGLHDMGGGSSEFDRASREEERALLAICGYLAVGQADRLAKIEARGELDLAEHMQAVLRSTMWMGCGNRAAVGQLLNAWYAPYLGRCDRVRRILKADIVGDERPW